MNCQPLFATGRQLLWLLAFLWLIVGATPLAAADNGKDHLGRPKNATEALKEAKKNIQEESGKLRSPTEDTWLIAIKDWCVKIGKATWKGTVGFGKQVFVEDLQVPERNIKVSGVLLFFLTLMIISGASAASTAIMRRHPALKFFGFGMAAVGFAPIYLLLKLDIKGEAQRLEELAEASRIRKAAQEEKERMERQAQMEAGQIVEPTVSAEGITWDQSYFKSIARNADGTPAGPWLVRYNGNTVHVLEIVLALPECVQVRFVIPGQNEQMGRIPYSRLEEWSDLPQ